MPPKRKHGSDAHDISAKKAERGVKRFAMLKPRIRHIAEHTVKTKWVTLPESAQRKVDELFHSIERPVITSHRDERKRIEAQSALATVRRKYVCVLWLAGWPVWAELEPQDNWIFYLTP